MPHRIRPRPAWVVPVTIGWTSFVTAGVADMLFFATFDPEQLADAATFPFELSRLGAYTLGFVLFWALAATAASIALWLLHAEPHRSDAIDALEGDEPGA